MTPNEWMSQTSRLGSEAGKTGKQIVIGGAQVLRSGGATLWRALKLRRISFVFHAVEEKEPVKSFEWIAVGGVMSQE